jgi:signal transduction histidine kinase
MIENMNAPKERILIVESDPTTSDLIARQTLVPLGYRVQVVGAATSALQDAIRFGPDLIITNLNLPGLSGKDLLVAFSSQGLEVPIIVVADKGMEGDVIQAFRLGAADFLTYPIREAEVVAAVERILKQVRARREKEQLSLQLNQTNQELQRRVRELTTIFAIGKAVISVTDLRALLDKIIEGAVYVTEADIGWLLTRDERSKNFLLSAFRNLPRSVAANLNKPWDDGLSSLVALSGETLAIHGDPLKRFKIASLGQSALVVPVKIKNEVVGLIVVVRKTSQPFSKSSQALLEAVADYASIAIVNARLFRVLEERVRISQQAANSAQFGERIGNELLRLAGNQLAQKVKAAQVEIEGAMQALQSGSGNFQAGSLAVFSSYLSWISEVAMTLEKSYLIPEESTLPSPNLNELARHSVQRFIPVAQKKFVSINTELASNPVRIDANPYHLVSVMDCFLSNAIRFSPKHSQVTVRVSIQPENFAHVAVEDHGPGISTEQLKFIFEDSPLENPVVSSQAADHFPGLGISLKLAREIVATYGGKIGAETKPSGGSLFHFSLPLARD